MPATKIKSPALVPKLHVPIVLTAPFGSYVLTKLVCNNSFVDAFFEIKKNNAIKKRSLFIF